MNSIGEIDLKCFEYAFPILTSEVVLTEERIEHIKKDHPGAYEKYGQCIPDFLREPDFILEANKPNSVVLLKNCLHQGKSIPLKLILRLKSIQDPDKYKNSVITFFNIDEEDKRRLIKNKKVLYKRE